MVGYRVLEAANLDEALRSLEQHPVDIVVTALDLPPDGSSPHCRLRSSIAWSGGGSRFALADSAEQVRERAGETGFQDCQVKFDQEAMLGSLARLASTPVSSEAVLACVGEER